jgi:hypothetical protein
MIHRKEKLKTIHIPKGFEALPKLNTSNNLVVRVALLRQWCSP